MVALVAMLAQEQPLGHQLNPFRLPGALLVLGNAAAFRFDGHGLWTGSGDQIELGGDAEAVAGEGHRTSDPGRFVVVGWARTTGGRRATRSIRFGVRQHVIELVHAPMGFLAFRRVDVVRPSPFDVHQVE